MTLDTTERTLGVSSKRGRYTSMFNKIRKPKGLKVHPSLHVAYLHIVNQHLEVDQRIDLSNFSYDELQEIVEFIEFKTNLQQIEYPEEFVDMAAYADYNEDTDD